MKKILSIFILLMCAFSLYANIQGSEENNTSQRTKQPARKSSNFNLSAGLFYTNNPEVTGGHFEIGFNLFSNVLIIQNRIVLRAGGFNANDFDNTVLTLSEKLIFAREEDEFARLYIYIEGGAGFYGNINNNFSSDTFVYSFGFGGGFEIGDSGFGALYTEFGYLGQKMIANFPLSGCVIQFGWRIYL